MPTGPAWNVDNPLKPWALFDPNAEIVIPFILDDWLAELGTTYSAHEVIAPSPLECESSTHASGVEIDGETYGDVLLIRMKRAADAEYQQRKYPLTVRLTGANGPDGGGPQTDDRTLYLKLQQR